MKIFLATMEKICVFSIPIYFGLHDTILSLFNVDKNNIFLCYIDIFLLIILFIALIYEACIQYRIFKYKKLLKLVKAYRSFLSGYFDDELKEVSINLTYTENERLTLYLYSSSQNAFYSIGRYSKSPKYNQIGRYIIDDTKEYVFAVVNEEKHYEKAEPIKDKWFNKRNMLSNDMYGVYIEDKGIKIGIIIAQSMKQKKFKNKEERQKLKNEAIRLQEKILQMKINPNALPSETDLMEKGL
ncbi:hypothetical protein [Helicobacter sp. MIT 05-5294]|uniref:hypothetical protein n=1 Tax=Helicobacter sp. MIT 05-5294 TaxID=1548150 RepID=UPI00051FE339|nr:hypothetical protein [Helicobacter sp. MIT 05-5294]TLD85760.1 hypothetical protein LS69_008170 [Helicobacter sp. MIT 05-5294]